MATLRQQTSFGPGIYRGHKFDIARLREFADGTNKAIAAGIPIPLLKRHARINADDDETTQFAQEEGAGWVTKVDVDAQGNLSWEAEGVPEPVANAVAAKTMRFTSPEFRPYYESEKKGVYAGPIIRHFAIVPKPGNPHQSPIETLAMSELAYQFSEEDRMPLDTEQFAEDKVHGRFFAPSADRAGHSDYSHKAFQRHILEHGGEHGATLKHGVFSFSLPRSKVDGFKKKTQNYFTHGTHYALDSQHSELSEDLRDDESFKGSMDKPELDEPNNLKSGEGESVEEETLNDDEEWFTDDSGKKSKRKKTAQEKKDDAGEAMASLTEKAPEQFAEDGVVKSMGYHTALNRRGWSKRPSTKGWSVYTHSDKPSVQIHVEHKTGKWEHGAPGGSMVNSGSSLGELNDHLNNYHGTKANSQHAEDDTDDKEEGKKKIPEAVDDPAETGGLVDIVQPESPPPAENVAAENPDMPPPKATDKTKLAAVLAGLNQKGIVLPSDYDFATTEGALDILLAALNSSIKAENDKEAEEATETEEDAPVNEAAMPFSEEEEDEALQFASLGELGSGSRYRVVRRSAKVPQNGGAKYRRAVHIRVYDTHHEKYTGKGKHGLVKEWANVDSRYDGPKSAHGKALHEAHQHAGELNAEHEGKSQQFEEAMPFSEDSNFYIYTDSEGKMPQLRRKPWKSDTHKHWVKYQNNTPVAANPHPGQDKVWHYGKGTYVPTPKSTQHTEVEHTEQFSESELAALPEKARNLIVAGQKALAEERKAKEKAQRDAIQFAEKEREAKNNAARDKAKTEIRLAKLPPAVKKQLIAAYETVQFSEGNEQPTYTAVEVAKLIASALPPSLQFLEENVVDAEPPKTQQFFEGGEVPTGHVSPERAREIVAGNPFLNKFAQAAPLSTRTEQVAAENSRVPNNVMRP